MLGLDSGIKAPGPPVRRARAFMRTAWTVSRILSAAPRGAACSHFSGPPVAGGLVARDPFRDPRTRAPAVARRPELLALARDGVCRALPVAGKAVRSYRTVSPLPRTPEGAVRRFALCCTVPHARPRAWVAVSQHRVQPCPDFPPHALRRTAAACPQSKCRDPGPKSEPAAPSWAAGSGLRDSRRAQAALMSVIFTRRYSARWPAWRR